jgi:formate--tetrahydrofolate ligase
VQKFGLPVVVAINHFTSDSPAEIAAVEAECKALGVEAYLCRHWADGGKGAVDLAKAVVALADSGKARFRPLYDEALPLADKIRAIATEPDLHGEDPIQLLGRSQSPGRAGGACPAGS